MKTLEPIILDYKAAQAFGDDRFVRQLNSQMRAKLRAQKVEVATGKRCVYIIRLKGSFLIAYPTASSPVLYIGRGDAHGRIASHLKNWLHHVRNFGIDTTVEIRIVLPLRQKRANFFKFVEAHLIAQHSRRYGGIPLFNSRREKAFEGQIYSDNEKKEMNALIGVGSGNRPWWALRPTRANPFREAYLKGLTANPN